MFIISSDSYAVKTTMHVMDDTISYQEGKFNFHKEEKDLFTEPHKPSKAPTQKAMIYQKSSRNLPREEKLLMRIKKGKDGRERIQETTEWPYLLHAQLSMDFSGNEYGGSGVLVGPHHLLTAGHNVYDPEEKEWAKTISVHFGLNDQVAPFGEIKTGKVYTFDKWVQENDKNYDMALITLKRSIGYELGWCGLLSLDESALLQEEVHITGYPGDKGFKQMWSMAHRIKKIEPERFYYDIDTFGGQSGSGVWIDKWRSPYVVGIHTLAEGEMFTGNSGVRLSADKLEEISKWISNTLILQ